MKIFKKAYSNSLYQQALAAKDPISRDLLWLLAAPDLVKTSWSGKPTLEQLGFSPRSLLTQLSSPPAQNQASWKAIQTASRQRLGLYHERLWQHILTQAPGIQPLAFNLAIRDRQRTLGELDILYRHLASGQLVHLEVAIKYYLGLPEGPEQMSSLSRWIGPGGIR